jgi:hypothetical protein
LLFMWAFWVGAWPLRVRAVKFGTSGAVPNDRLPAFTENWLVSVTADAAGAAKSRAAMAARHAREYLLLLTFIESRLPFSLLLHRTTGRFRTPNQSACERRGEGFRTKVPSEGKKLV